MIITSFEAEVCAWWNSKFRTSLFERWLVIIIFKTAENWVTRKKRSTLKSIHPKNNPSDCEVDVNHKKWLRLFLNLIKNFTRYSTACCCTPYCEVELLRRVAHMFGPASHLFDSVPEECWIFDLVNIPLNCALKYWLRVTKILIFSLRWLTVFFLNGTASTPFFPIRFRVSSKGKPPIPSAFS